MVQVVVGPPVDVREHEQLPSALICLHEYDVHWQVSPVPGHCRSAQQTPLGTIESLHDPPVKPVPVSIVVQLHSLASACEHSAGPLPPLPLPDPAPAAVDPGSPRPGVVALHAPRKIASAPTHIVRIMRARI